MDSTVNDNAKMAARQAGPAQVQDIESPMHQATRYREQAQQLMAAANQLEKQFDQQQAASDRANLSQAMQAGPSLIGSNGKTSLAELLQVREKQYGKFSNFALLAQTLEQVFYQLMQHHNSDQMKTLTHSQREALHMTFVKLARIGTGNPHHRDSWLDLAGYPQLIADELDEF